MRKFIRTLVLLLLFAALFPFLFPWKDGKPLLSWSDLRLPKMPALQMPQLPGKGEAKRELHQPVKLYRWQAADGTTQYSSEPPHSVAYEIVEVHPDANLIQAPATKGAATATGLKEEETLSVPSPLTVSPGEAMQLLEDTRRVREMSQQRLQQQEALVQ